MIQPVNVGQRRDLGASLAMQGPLVRGFSYTLNANLNDRRIEREIFGALGVQQSTNYTATAQLDYRDGTDGRRGADRVTLTANFSGPYDDGLVHRSSFVRATATWSHAVTDRLSAVLTIDDLLGPTEYRSTSISDTVLSRARFLSDGPRVKVALTYSFGRPGQPQQQQQPTGPPTPGVPIPGAQ